MTQIRSKNPRHWLTRESYRQLHRQVLERDKWRCQNCGATQHLQVHHIVFRSRSGGDEEENLITLCAECHRRKHGF